MTATPSSRPTGQVLILASGGIDSSTMLALAKTDDTQPNALFVDYGQPAAQAERSAVENVCAALGVALLVVRYAGRATHAGEILGRNAFLLHAALLEFQSSEGVIMIGIHAGTGYQDCSPEFIGMMQQSFEYHTRGSISLVAPFVAWTKSDVFRLSQDLKVPVMLTYSCEASTTPCGKCRSCRDRVALGLPEA